MNHSPRQALKLISDRQANIVLNSHFAHPQWLRDAWNVFQPPGREHLQALAGLGLQLPVAHDMTDGELKAVIHRAPYLDRFATIMRATMSNIWLDLHPALTAVLKQEANEALESAPARLVSEKSVVLARRVHIVDENSERVFLRAIDYSGGPLDIQSNVGGLVIEPNPIGQLSRAMLDECGWRLEPGWWWVQSGGQRVDNTGFARLRRPTPILDRPKPILDREPQVQEETPESSVPTPRSR